MNRTYRLVWNKKLRVAQVASEHASGHGGISSGSAVLAPRINLLCLAFLASGTFIHAGSASAQTCTPAVSSACSAVGGGVPIFATGDGAGGGGAGNGMGGAALRYDVTTAPANQGVGAQSFNGTGGNGASGTQASPSVIITGGTGGAVGGVGQSYMGGRGGDGTDHAVSPSAGGGGGAGEYTSDVDLSLSSNASITGGAGGNGGNMLSGPGFGAGGGGGGGAGLISIATNFALRIPSTASSIIGGAGGNGGNNTNQGVAFSGGGGGGGDGVLMFGMNSLVENNGTIRGGVGGAAGIASSNVATGSAGASGAGIRALHTGLTVTNTGTISGGALTGNGAAGAGIITQGGATITNSGTLAGGSTGSGYASAVLFNGTGGNLNLMSGSIIHGAVELSANATATITTNATSSLDGVKLNGGTADVLFNLGASTALDVGDALTGTGTVRSAGAGSLTLRGVNLTGTLTLEHTGSTYASGTIHSTGAQSYTGAVSYDSSAEFNSGAGITFGATVSGLTGLTVTAGGDIVASGELTLGGNSSFSANGNDITLSNSANTFTGTVSAAGHNINIAAGSALQLSTIVASNNLSLTSPNIILNGSINTTGTLTLAGGTVSQIAGTIATDTLTGTLSGNLTLGNIGNQITSLSDLTASDVVLASAAGITITGDVNTRTLTLLTTGRSTVTGSLESTNGVTVVSGTELAIGNGGTTGTLAGDVAANGTLLFNRSNIVAYSGVLSGNGSLVKQGIGTLQLSGDSSSFSGTTTVEAGTLQLNGSLGGALTLNNGATLSGTGTTSDVSINSGGILAPGNSIGTLTVNGNLTMNAGSIYRVEANAAGASDKVVVNGTATLNGNVVALPDSGGNYQANTQYTILTAGNALVGQFNSNVSSSLAFLDASVSQDIHNVYLNLRRNDIAYADVAHTRNQRNVANALQSTYAAGGGSPAMSDVVTAVNNLSADKARAAFDSMSGAGLAGLQRAAFGFTGSFSNQLNGRLQSAGTSRTAQSINGMQLAANDRLGDLMPALTQNTMSDTSSSGKFSMAGGVPMDDGKRGFWLRGYGFDQDTDSDGNAASTRIKGVGISAGFDKRIQDNLVIGAAFSHGTSDVRASFAETGKSRGNALATYASYASGPWNFNGNLILAHNANSMNRNITVGALSSTARANFDSKTVAAYGEASYDLPQSTWTLQPLAGLSVTHNRNDAFTETGAGALNIQANAQSTTSSKTLFGARALFEFSGIHVQPRAIWSHEFGDVNKGLSAQLQGSPAAAFITYGVDLPRDSLIIGTTIAGKTKDGLSLFADVQGEFNSRQTGMALLVGMRKSW